MVVFAALWLPKLGQPVPKGQPSTWADLGIGIGMGLLLAWSAAVKKRWLVGLVALWIGFIGPWGPNTPVSVIRFAWIALGGWLLVKNSRAQVAAAKEANREAAAQGAATGAGTARGGGGRGRGRGRGKQPLDTTGRPIPSASKRYTPPARPGKNDQRQRRERRAQAARGEDGRAKREGRGSSPSTG